MFIVHLIYVSALEKSLKSLPNQSINRILIRVCPCLDEIRWYLHMLLVLIACQRFQKVRLGKKSKEQSIKQLSLNKNQSSKYHININQSSKYLLLEPWKAL
jgi:hypothetical protein